MNYDKQLAELRDNLEKAKSMKYRAEARLEQLKNQEQEIINQLNKLGINPENLDKEISDLTLEIENLFDKANKLLPKDLLEKK